MAAPTTDENLTASWNIHDIDKSMIFSLEEAKNRLLLNLFHVSDSDRHKEISEFMLSAKSLMEKYTEQTPIKDGTTKSTYLLSMKVSVGTKEYNFYEIENVLDKERELDIQKTFLEKAILIYNKFMKDVLRVALPFEKIDKRKKAFLPSSLFSLVKT